MLFFCTIILFLQVSPIQELQMITVVEPNVHIFRTLGNNDDQSNALKEIFSDHTFVHNNNIVSINSINWARIAAQSTYYVWAYLQIFQTRLSIGQPVDFSIPSGAFGNGMGGLLAKKMGLPIGRILCATNANGAITVLVVSVNTGDIVWLDYIVVYCTDDDSLNFFTSVVVLNLLLLF